MKDNIKIKGHRGTWYAINQMSLKGKMIYLLEHEKYGDEAACLIVDEDCNIIMENVWNGFQDLA